MIEPRLAAFAAEVGAEGPVAVEGGRSRWCTGGSVRDGTRLVRAPSGVLEHRPSEMTVRVLAGTDVAELETVLAAAGQRTALPLRGGTVGGAVSVGEDHLDVPFRGTVRSSVLQVRYVAADGRLVTGGAPTVKNVTGFDLPRLVTGALGTLGLLAEVTLRTNPCAPASLWLRAEGADPFAVATALLRQATVLWDGVCTWVHLQGHRVDVDERRRLLPGRWHEAESPPVLAAYRWSLRPSELRDLPARGVPFVASVGVGIAFLAAPPPPRSVDAGALRLGRRAKALFDPAGRLNPGRDPARR